MKIQLLRSATVKFEYAGKKFIIDPYLAAKHSMPSYTGKSLNPLVELCCSPLEAIDGIDMLIISHLHSDHFDPTAQKLLPKNLTVLCQPEDESAIKTKGFNNVFSIVNKTKWEGITIIRVPGQHGSGEVLEEMGQTSGFVFQSENEPTVYWAGDTVWCKPVADVIAQIHPAIIITHSCGAKWGDGVLIVMDDVQTIMVCRAAPASTIIATHMDSLDHATVSRVALRKYAEKCNISNEQLKIPLDGETYTFHL